jgi:GntR family transcriptional regulator
LVTWARSANIVTIDESVPTPPYAQIFEQLRALIERGDLQPGELLPPVRQLAGDLGVAPNTVVRAYADLKAGGWVTSEDRKHTRVAAGTPRLTKTSRRGALDEAVGAFLNSLRSRGYNNDEIAAELRRRIPALNL